MKKNLELYTCIIKNILILTSIYLSFLYNFFHSHIYKHVCLKHMNIHLL